MVGVCLVYICPFVSDSSLFWFLISVFASVIQFIFSTALDGKIKAWLYDNMRSRVDYDAPGRWCTTMAYSADGTRLMCLTSCICVSGSLFPGRRLC